MFFQLFLNNRVISLDELVPSLPRMMSHSKSAGFPLPVSWDHVDWNGLIQSDSTLLIFVFLFFPSFLTGWMVGEALYGKGEVTGPHWQLFKVT